MTTMKSKSNVKIPKISNKFWDNMEWGRIHHTELLKKYPDMWVAIVDHCVVSAGKNLMEVKNTARKKTGKKNIPVVYVECGAHIYGHR